MAKPYSLPPSAASLTASLRDLGYSLETAVADLIDNSISAEATEINVFCDLSRSAPVLVIVDNGRGLTGDDVIAAMRHGAIDPRKKRGPKDLGRFGLGLKTASFSQCRRLTVVSTVKGVHAGAEWNLDEVEKLDDWLLAREEVFLQIAALIACVLPVLFDHFLQITAAEISNCRITRGRGRRFGAKALLHLCG